jgi:RNA polymerase sigma factor (sigma-70 family)
VGPPVEGERSDVASDRGRDLTAEAGFVAFYRAHHPRLVASLLLTTGDAEVATDAVDEAFVRALARWDRVSAMTSPAGWTYRVALNVARRQFRRRQLERTLLARRRPGAEAPPGLDHARELVADLPPRQRTAMVLRYVADLTEPEIAQAMGIRRSTVSATLAAARARLARDLSDEAPPARTPIDSDATPLPGGSHG